MQSLAVKYRPKTFDDVTEQGATKVILQQQLASGTQKHCYLFCGGAGTGKTTCARIFANEINKGQGNPIELDAASNNGVDDVRQIIEQAQSRSLDSEYKVFIIDECHAISSAGWQAFLKLIEEPPAKSIFIFCTTDPQKIPKTILSRVERYDFQRISQEGIVDRLNFICISEEIVPHHMPIDNPYWDAIEYIAKIADGGMRDAITLLDKCLSYSQELTIGNVLEALGIAPYEVYMKLTDLLIEFEDKQSIVKIIEDVHASGKDLKQFIHQYLDFVLDVCKYMSCKDLSVTRLPQTDEMVKFLSDYYEDEWYANEAFALLDMVLELDNAIKFSSSPKTYIEAKMITWRKSK